MATRLLENISTLVTVRAEDPSSSAPRRCGAAMGEIGVMHDADVAIDGATIAWVGPSGTRTFDGAERIDCSGRTLLPGFVDSHTHIAFAGDRAHEFAMRLRGATYQEIAAAGGGILSTMRAVRGGSVDSIAHTAKALAESAFAHGTTTIEAKSGYGLDTDNEVKLLEAIAALAAESPAEVIATFLGAHDVPPEHRDDRSAYIAEIIDRMLPLIAERGLARFCDVFSDTGYYTPEEAETILTAAQRLGFGLKLHADELSSYGGAELAARLGAASADHLLMISDAGIDAMQRAGVVATLLPGTAFFLGLPYAPARTMIERGLCVALATDCNPGSNMSENMQMTLALACMGMRMTVEEAITAATLNGAAALGISRTVGSIEEGKQADMILLNIPDYPGLVYHYGVNHVEAVIKRGRVWRRGADGRMATAG